MRRRKTKGITHRLRIYVVKFEAASWRGRKPKVVIPGMVHLSVLERLPEPDDWTKSK